MTFLHQKWARELEYRLIKEVWTYGDNRIAVRFAYESHSVDGQWFRSHGNENCEFDEHGLMRQRHASINDTAIDVAGHVIRLLGGQNHADVAPQIRPPAQMRHTAGDLAIPIPPHVADVEPTAGHHRSW